jgi:selenide,water dikinase
MLSNRAARPGDAVVLTKALGTGFITTANRAGVCPSDVLDAACASMIALNAPAAEAARAVDARAATDVTGFGLAGHAAELAQASGVTVEIELARLPLLPGVDALLEHRTRANATNRAHLSLQIDDAAAEAPHLDCLFDPQTSGGLLVCVADERADEVVERCRASGLDAATRIGVVTERTDADIVVRG